jgi:hypothetical protein
MHSLAIRDYSGCIKFDRHWAYSDGSLNYLEMHYSSKNAGQIVKGLKSYRYSTVKQISTIVPRNFVNVNVVHLWILAGLITGHWRFSPATPETGDSLTCAP